MNTPAVSDLQPGRTRRLFAGGLATMGTMVLTIVAPFVLVPLFIHVWGAQRYGEWLIVSALMGYFAVFDFGIQAYVVNRLGASFAEGDLLAYNRTLQSALYLSVVSCGLLFTFIVCTVFWLPLDTWLRLELTIQPVVSVVMVLLGLQFLSSIPQGLLLGIYRTLGETPRGIVVASLQRLAQLVLVIAALLWRQGFVVVAAVQLLPLVITTAWTLLDLRRRHPSVELGFAQRDVALALSFVGPSLLFFLIQTAQVLSLQGSVLVVGAALGATGAAVFTTLRTLANVIRQVSGSATNLLWPEITAMAALGQFAELRFMHQLAAKANMMFSVCAAGFLSLAARDVVALWTHGQIAFDPHLMNAFLAMLVTQAPWLTSSAVLGATNNHRLLAWCTALAAAVGIGLAYVGARYWGLAGVVYGMWIADLAICALLIPHMACRHIGQRVGSYWVEVVGRGLPVLIVLWLILTGLDHLLAPLAPFPRLAVLAVATLIAPGLGYFTWLGREERARVRQTFGRLRNRGA